MTFDEALSLVEKTHPDLYFTGNAYIYKRYYMIEMSDEEHPSSIVYDGYLKVDRFTKKITPYIPALDGIPKPNEKKPV